MDFLGTIGVLRRRWYVVVPALLVSAILTFVIYLGIPTRYESTATVVLTSPSLGGTFSSKTSPEDVARVNPLLAFDGSLTTTALIIGQVLRDPATQEELGVTAASGSSYTAGTGDLGGPFVVVTTNTTSAAESEALAARVVERVRTELDERQRALDAPPSTFIQPQVLVNPTKADAQIGGKVRFAGAAAMLSVLLTLAATFGAESLQGGRRRLLAGGNSLLAGDRDAPAADPVPAAPSGSVGQEIPRRIPPPVPHPTGAAGATARVPQQGFGPAEAAALAAHPRRPRPRMRPPANNAHQGQRSPAPPSG